MNPKEFDWSESQPVTVINPTSEDFSFMVHSKPYTVKAGTTVQMPGFLAWHFVYGLAGKIVQEEGNFAHWNEEGFRKQYYDKLIVGADPVLTELEEEPGPQIEERPSAASEPEPGTGGTFTPDPAVLGQANPAPIKPMKAKTNAGSSKA